MVFSVAFGLGHLVQGRAAAVITRSPGGPEARRAATAVEALAGAPPLVVELGEVGGEGRVLEPAGSGWQSRAATHSPRR